MCECKKAGGLQIDTDPKTVADKKGEGGTVLYPTIL